jgi:diguanylate cyclase (GGDEF)-like protein
MILWDWWWLVLVTLITVIISTIIFTYTRVPVYETNVRLVVSPSATNVTSLSELRAATIALDKPIVANTYAEIGQSPAIVNAAWEQLGLKRQKGYTIRATVLPLTSLVIITVDGPDPALVQQLANAVTDQTLGRVSKLYEVYDLSVLDPASLPSAPSSPNTQLNLVLGVVLGLGLGILAAFLAEYLKTPMQIEQLSILDTKTGAYKDSYLLRRLRSEISRSKRVQRPFVVGVVRLENFEEMVGHLSPGAKQMILKQMVQLFNQVLPEENLVAQWRGDMLAVLMPDFDLQDAQRILQKVQAKLDWTAFEVGETGFKLNFTSSFGLATYDLNGVTPEGLIQQAEEALYNDKIDYPLRNNGPTIQRG